MIYGLKGLALHALTHSFLLPAYRRFTRDAATVLMMHRFADSVRGNAGDDLERLRENLEFLRGHRFDVISVGELMRRLDADEPLKKSVVFTVDDGYADFASAAAPIFAAYDCPVTVFLTTGFVDGSTWFWWDKVSYMIATTKQARMTTALGGVRIAADLTSEAGRNALMGRLHSWGRHADVASIDALLSTMSADLEVSVPARPPPRFAPLSWDDCRRLEAFGMSFGPHTVTHPNLAMLSRSDADHEIGESWRRVKAELRFPMPVIAYPYGMYTSFTEGNRAFARSNGIQMGFASESGQVTPVQRDPSARFMLPRMAYDSEPRAFRQVISGLERVKDRFRRLDGNVR